MCADKKVCVKILKCEESKVIIKYDPWNSREKRGGGPIAKPHAGT